MLRLTLQHLRVAIQSHSALESGSLSWVCLIKFREIGNGLLGFRSLDLGYWSTLQSISWLKQFSVTRRVHRAILQPFTDVWSFQFGTWFFKRIDGYLPHVKARRSNPNRLQTAALATPSFMVHNSSKPLCWLRVGPLSKADFEGRSPMPQVWNEILFTVLR